MTSFRGQARQEAGLTVRVKVEDNRLFLTTQDSNTGEQETVVQTILNLSGNELVIRDEDKLVYRIRRKQ